MTAEQPALVFLNGIGDHFINLPAIRALTELFPNKLRIFCRRGASELLSSLDVHTVHELDWGLDARDEVLASDYVVNLLRPCDLLISLNPWFTPPVEDMVRRVAAKSSIGFFPCFSFHVPLDFAKHSAELAYDIPRKLGITSAIERYSEPPQFPSWATKVASDLRECLPPHTRVIVVHPETIREKMWSLENFQSVLTEFLGRHKEFVALIVGVSDLGLDVGACADRILSCAGLPFYASASVVSKADIFLGIDSCMLHVADICGVAGVGLFGPTSPAEFGFRVTPIHRHVFGYGCMENVQVPEVVEALEQILASKSNAGTVLE